jgi:hypothetical protein
MNTTSQTLDEAAPASHRVGEIRWGGAALALGAVLYITAIILGRAVFGAPEGTGPGGRVTLADTAAHIRARWNLAQGLWSTEMAGALLIGLAALVLQRRRQAGPPWLPGSVAWIAVGVGASILTAQYAFTVGSYPPALAVFQEQPAIFAALRGGMRNLFYIGMAAMFFGLSGAFLAEASGTDSVVPKWVALIGAAVTLLATIRWIAMFAGIIGGLSPPLGLAAFLWRVFWVWRFGEGFARLILRDDTSDELYLPEAGSSVVSM